MILDKQCTLVSYTKLLLKLSQIPTDKDVDGAGGHHFMYVSYKIGLTGRKVVVLTPSSLLICSSLPTGTLQKMGGCFVSNIAP